MKRTATLFLLFAFSLAVMGQIKMFSGQNPDSVVRINPQMQQFDHVPGEILVKFRDNVPVNFKKSRAGLKSSQAFMNTLIRKYGIVDGQRLFPNEKRLKTVQILTAPNGEKFARPSLHNIFLLKLKTDKRLRQTIQSLKADSASVVYAEPNYILSVVSDKPESPVLSEADLKTLRKVRNTNTLQLHDTVMPNDPLYPQQWNIPAIKADRVWTQTKGSKTQVIAILDTGVDWKHPDLQNKIWTNPGEIPDNGIDDDGDGLVDDVRGWDWINHDNNPTDDNSHGTHCAGIAAAEANNGIGIAGVDWHAEIMPLKVFQSSGRGDAATISKGINYAATHGATAISMSFGSYALSQTMQDALANAYADCILVAAAGNDHIAIGPCTGCAPFFPAALSFVLGVQSPEASFSNYDQDGPTFSRYAALWNYEMKAPGTNILSTIPGGNYRKYSGTSMATPLVAGAISLYRQLIPADSETNEFMWVKLIQSTNFYLNIDSALTLKPKPEIWFLSNHMVDTLGNDDRDGRVDAGETIQLWFRARNTGGQVDSVYWKIKLAEFEDTSTCHILKSTSYIGTISPYATRTSENDPMVFKISPNVIQGRDITFDLMSWYKGAADTLKQMFVFTAENGTELKGVLDSTRILTPDRLYLVNNSFKVGANGHLIIKPGTKLLIYPGKPIIVKGKLTATGTPDSLITFEGYVPPSQGGSGYVNGGINYTNTPLDGHKAHNLLEYCRFEKIGNIFNSSVNYLTIPTVKNCSINCWGQQGIGMVDSLLNSLVVQNNIKEAFDFYHYAAFNNVIGPSTTASYYIPGWETSPIATVSGTDYFYRDMPFHFNNFINYTMPTGTISDTSNRKNCWISEYSKPKMVWEGSFYRKTQQILIKYRTGSGFSYNSEDFQKIQNQYWGTADSAKIEGFIYDFMDDPNLPRAVFKPYLNAPPDSCHGVVWKVLIDDKDPQDEHLDALGVGPHRFDVYFNRPMDTSYTPKVAFGVRYPFSSVPVRENPSWSADGRVFTAYAHIKLYTGDGKNRVRVSGARDTEGWEIPLEDMRFDFLISAAESSSVDFMATPGLGKVNLEWNNSGLKDLLGFNMYRMQQINDSTLSTPVLINKSLILDTLYTDFDVVPNKKYYYYYKVVNTDFSESDSSHVVSAVPFTASRGDANGDMSVNVLDITAIVSYMLDENPQPFIVTAADVNGDSTINVLDIIGVVQLISGKKSIGAGTLPLPQTSSGKAWYSLKGKDMYLESDGNLAALQFRIKRDTLPGSKTGNKPLQLLLQQKGFEFACRTLGNETIGFLYSLTGKTMPKGNIKLLRLEGASWGDVDIAPIFGGDRHGNYVTVLKKAVHQPGFPGMHAITVYPNPFGPSATIYYKVPEKGTVALELYNLAGQKVRELFNGYREAGKYTFTWNRARAAGQALSPGIYILRYVLNEGSGYHVQQQIKVVITR